MVNKRVKEVFNDGVLKILTQVTIRNAAGKKIGVTDKAVASLRFRNLSIRESDIETMQALDSKIAKKLKTPMHPICRDFNNDQYFIVVRNTQFNVIYVDSDNYYSFWYLEKIGEYSGRDESEGKVTSVKSDAQGKKST